MGFESVAYTLFFLVTLSNSVKTSLLSIIKRNQIYEGLNLRIAFPGNAFS